MQEGPVMAEEVSVKISFTPSMSGEVWKGGWPQTRQEFELFVERFMDRLVIVAFHRLGRMEDAEDVIQNVFVKAYADREKLRNVRRVGPYLYRMVANACNEHGRKRKFLLLEEIDTEEPLDGQSSVHDQIAASTELQRIEQYLLDLPEPQAEVIRLRVLDGFSLQEIADLTGNGLPTIKSRLRYGLKKLRQIVPFTREESE